MSRFLGTVVALCVLLSAMPVLADDFEAKVAEGMRYYNEQNWEKAIELFLQARIERDEPDLTYNVARAYHKKGDCISAKKYYAEFSSRDDADPDRQEKAGDHSETLGECKTTGELRMVCSPDTTMVQINDEDPVKCGSVDLDPGEYLLIFTAPGYAPANTKVTLTAGQREAVTQSLEPLRDPSGNIVEPPGEDNTLMWIGVGLTAAGAAAIITTVIIDVINFNGNAAELEKLPLGDTRRRNFEDAYTANQTVMYITGGLGVALLGTGIALWVLGAMDDEDSASADQSSLYVLPAVPGDGVGANLRLTF